jgi:hypothetical protein
MIRRMAGNGRAGVHREVERLVRGLSRRSRAAVFLGVSLRWSAAGFLLSGTLVLLARTTWGLEPAPLLAFLAPALAAGALGGLLAARRGISLAGAATWIDVSTGGSGLVVTGVEEPDARWSATFEKTLERVGRMPGLRVGRPFGLAAAAGLFLAAALWVRIPAPTPGPSPELFEAVLASLGEKLDTLSENVDLDEGLAEELEGRFERLEEMLEDSSPESLFEALDSFEERLGLESERVREELESAATDLASAALDRLADPETAQASLERALSALREAGLTEGLPARLQELLGADLQLPDGVQLDAAELMELAQGLSELMEGRLSNLVGAGLLDPTRLKMLASLKNLDEFLPTAHECDAECEAGGG